MSKSKGNVVEPWTVLDHAGADAFRWYLFTAQSPWDSFRFSLDVVDETRRRFLFTLWNTYAFLTTYASLPDGFTPGDPAPPVAVHAGGESPADQKKTVTSGCGQGTMFGNLMDYVQGIEVAAHRVGRSVIHAVAETIRLQQSLYKISGSVHGCALFQGPELLLFTEDVGRHNALDAIAGWMWLNGVSGGDKVLYTTGRLTSEMVIKAAQMGVGIVVSRSGVTQMGLEVAQQLGLCLIARCINRHFLIYCGQARIDLEA